MRIRVVDAVPAPLAIARAALIELAAVHQTALGIEQEGVRRAHGRERPGHRLRFVVEHREREPFLDGHRLQGVEPPLADLDFMEHEHQLLDQRFFAIGLLKCEDTSSLYEELRILKNRAESKLDLERQAKGLPVKKGCFEFKLFKTF